MYSAFVSLLLSLVSKLTILLDLVNKKIGIVKIMLSGYLEVLIYDFRNTIVSIYKSCLKKLQ